MSRHPLPIQVKLNPRAFTWARERSKRGIEGLSKEFPDLSKWEQGIEQPTAQQLEKYAKDTYTPVPYFFISEIPDDTLPIHDFRTFGNQSISRPSADLLDTIYACQERQEWYKEYAIENYGEEPLPLVGKYQLSADPIQVVQDIRKTLGFDKTIRKKAKSNNEYLKILIKQIENIGILVMFNAVVGDNPKRQLSLQEFRGFALYDPIAPLIFINAGDSVTAQLFTLAHELAHLCLGESGVSNPDMSDQNDKGEISEKWCNQVAAELLVSEEELREKIEKEFNGKPLFIPEHYGKLAKGFKVSTLVILLRLLELGYVTKEAFWKAYREEKQKFQDLTKNKSQKKDQQYEIAEKENEGEKKSSNTPTKNSQSPSKSKSQGQKGRIKLLQQVSRRFAQALISDTLEGGTLYRDAFSMLDIKDGDILRQLWSDLSIPTHTKEG